MSVRTQQYVILSREHAAQNGLAPIGDRSQLTAELGRFNTAAEIEGGDVLYGPGIRIEMPPTDPISQMLMTVTEEEIAWIVIERLARTFNWKILDPATGREWAP